MATGAGFGPPIWNVFKRAASCFICAGVIRGEARSSVMRNQAHIAQAQFGQCSALKGVPSPTAGKNLEQELKTKAEVTKALADSFALCDDLFANVTDANATEMVKQGNNEVTRAASLFGVIVHGNEMAGTAYVYLRSKNIVPP